MLPQKLRLVKDFRENFQKILKNIDKHREMLYNQRVKDFERTEIMTGGKIAIFDLDGTVLDTLADLSDSVNRMLTHFGFPTHEYDEIKSMVGDGARKLALRAIPNDLTNEEAEECVAYFLGNYHDNANKKTRPYEGIRELMISLRARGTAIAVVTNKPHTAAVALCEKFFGELIDITLGDREGIKRKPSPDSVLFCMSSLGCDKAVYIGDADTDIETAKNANIPSISVSWGFRSRAFLEAHGARVIVDSADALLLEIERALDGEAAKEHAEEEK